MNDFGGKLRLARERRGISLRQIATTTKISLGALEALEAQRPVKTARRDLQPVLRPVLRHIEVGLDPDATVHEFLERFQALQCSAGVPRRGPAGRWRRGDSAARRERRCRSGVGGSSDHRPGLVRQLASTSGGWRSEERSGGCVFLPRIYSAGAYRPAKRYGRHAASPACRGSRRDDARAASDWQLLGEVDC